MSTSEVLPPVTLGEGETTLTALQLQQQGITEIVDLQDVIGQGAFGKVYRGVLKMPIKAPNGQIIPTGQIVAVKEQLVTENINLRALAAEIAALKTAMSGNCEDVNQIFDILYDPRAGVETHRVTSAPVQYVGKIYLVVEFIQGKEMFNMMHEYQPAAFQNEFPEELFVARIVNPLIEGLHCLHKNELYLCVSWSCWNASHTGTRSDQYSARAPFNWHRF
jgi:serine/threonine protein kinase